MWSYVTKVGSFVLTNMLAVGWDGCCFSYINLYSQRITNIILPSLIWLPISIASCVLRRPTIQRVALSFARTFVDKLTYVHAWGGGKSHKNASECVSIHILYVWELEEEESFSWNSQWISVAYFYSLVPSSSLPLWFERCVRTHIFLRLWCLYCVG